MMIVIRDLISIVGDGNKNIKKRFRLEKKSIEFLHCAFLYTSLSSLHTMT